MQHGVNIGILREKVLNVLQYYVLFQYPLRVCEICSNCSIPTSEGEVEVTLHELTEEEKVFSYKGFYSGSRQVKNWAERRIAGNRMATSKMQQALAAGRLIYLFPFVKLVGISGSLSKGYASQDSDFDFFILTSENRLWICRTILHLFKKMTFLFGQQHKFCMNYFLDECRPELEEKNIYTAIELSTLIPVAGSEAYKTLMQQNLWIKNFLPNEYKQFYSGTIRDKKFFGARILELPFSFTGGFLNSWLMRITDKRWRKKWMQNKYKEEDYALAFKTTLYHSKNHPANHQKKILESLKKVANKEEVLIP